MLFNKLPYFILALAALAAGPGHLADLFIAMRSRLHAFNICPLVTFLQGQMIFSGFIASSSFSVCVIVPARRVFKSYIYPV